MCEYVNGLVVEVEEAAQATGPALQRPVAGEHVRVELQVLRHVPPVEQLHAAGAARRRGLRQGLRRGLLILARVQQRPLPLTPLLIITDMLQRLFPLLRSLPVHLLN